MAQYDGKPQIPWLSDQINSLPEQIGIIVELALLSFAGLIVFYLTKRILRPLLKKVVAKSKNQWDDVLVSPQFIFYLSWIPVTAVGNYGTNFLHETPEWFLDVVTNVSRSLTLVVVLFAIGTLLNGINKIYTQRPISKQRPIKGYIQIVKILLYGIGGLSAISLLVDESPWKFLAGIGAMTAVLLLIFKDTILSLVASVTVMTNDMVRVGDWIEIPSAGIDGDVVDLSLHTVKIQNFDRTVSYVPTYRLVNSTLKNWRGMQEAGGRRIKRALQIDLGTVRFLTTEEVTRFGRFALLKDYIAGKEEELQAWNAEHHVDGDIPSNVRRLTNLGTLRAYIVNYLKSREDIYSPGSGMTFLIRQLQPGEHGVPLEVYVFTTTTNWVEYEGIQADIFDHIFAMVPELGLKVFQDPTGADFRSLSSKG